MIEIVHCPYLAFLAWQAKAILLKSGERGMRRRAFLAASLAALAAPASAQTTPATAPRASRPAPMIEPENPLEQAFLEAFDTPALRAAFRREFLASPVALALSARDPSAPPRSIQLRPGVYACLIFTSSARAAAVMGPGAPKLVLTGREALERVRGTNVVININLTPYLTLEPEDVEAYLTLTDEEFDARQAAPPSATAPNLTGPSQ
jgi:hypothetical protein